VVWALVAVVVQNGATGIGILAALGALAIAGLTLWRAGTRRAG
jgi:hypothetical protein